MTAGKGTNLHIYPAPIVSESRIFRQTAAVEEAELFDEVEICGTSAPGLPSVEPLSERRRIRRVGSHSKGSGSVLRRVAHQILWSVQVYRSYAGKSIGAVNAHSVAVLPVAVFLARRHGARLIYDTHELETETATSRGAQGRIFKLLERRYIRRCDVVFVVNDLIREWYEETYPGIRATSVVNSPVGEIAGTGQDLRSELGIPGESRLYVHVGNLGAARHIPELLEVFKTRSNDHLVFVGDGPLRTLIAETAVGHPNIHLFGTVDSSSVVPTLESADVGICVIEPSCLSYALSLPNKAIEYIAAGTPFIHNELPAVDRLLAGRLAPFRITSVETDLPRTLDSITPVDVSDARSDLADVALPSWASQSDKMIRAYREVLGRPRSESAAESKERRS
ncbi:glycosyltransferase [Microbacterium sp. 22242]|uniref:glycosyltransferase n=1 Tax=Microbacterium sp. 22242 TaxID=3453896 RepID=UPI003F84FDE1